MYKPTITEQISLPALVENLAEEAAELAQAASKYARILRGENPTPVTPTEGYFKMVEEYTDVALLVDILEIEVNKSQMLNKRNRWLARLEEHNGYSQQ